MRDHGEGLMEHCFVGQVCHPRSIHHGPPPNLANTLDTNKFEHGVHCLRLIVCAVS